MKKETAVKEEIGRAQKKARKEASTVVSGTKQRLNNASRTWRKP